MKTEGKYILDAQKRVIPEHDLFVWGRWLEDPANLRVKQERIGQKEISTIFLGMASVRSEVQGGTPREFFETMVFSLKENGERDEILEQERCDTWEEAEAQHARLATAAASEPQP